MLKKMREMMAGEEIVAVMETQKSPARHNETPQTAKAVYILKLHMAPLHRGFLGSFVW